jgi:hypothetical protein
MGAVRFNDSVVTLRDEEGTALDATIASHG